MEDTRRLYSENGMQRPDLVSRSAAVTPQLEDIRFSQLDAVRRVGPDSKQVQTDPVECRAGVLTREAKTQADGHCDILPSGRSTAVFHHHPHQHLQHHQSSYGGAGGLAPHGAPPVVLAPFFPKYEVIAVRERHGRFRKAVPCMPIAVAIFCCLLNVVTPGVGTLLAGLTVTCGCPTEHDSRCRSFFYNFVAAVLQLGTAPFVVGWVWSIMWGVTFVNVSLAKGQEDTIVAHF